MILSLGRVTVVAPRLEKDSQGLGVPEKMSSLSRRGHPLCVKVESRQSGRLGLLARTHCQADGGVKKNGGPQRECTDTEEGTCCGSDAGVGGLSFGCLGDSGRDSGM